MIVNRRNYTSSAPQIKDCFERHWMREAPPACGALWGSLGLWVLWGSLGLSGALEVPAEGDMDRIQREALGEEEDDCELGLLLHRGRCFCRGDTCCLRPSAPLDAVQCVESVLFPGETDACRSLHMREHTKRRNDLMLFSAVEKENQEIRDGSALVNVEDITKRGSMIVSGST